MSAAASAAAAAASAANVAVIGGGIAGAVCASLLAARGVAVTLFDSGRGAGGRMAQRREVMEDGTELRFDHGAPYFTVSNDEVARVVSGWEARGLVAEWKAMFACFDREAGKFIDFEKVWWPNLVSPLAGWTGFKIGVHGYWLVWMGEILAILIML